MQTEVPLLQNQKQKRDDRREHHRCEHKIVSKQKSYESQFYWVNRDLIGFHRSDVNLRPYVEVDANPEHWAFFVVFNLEPGQVHVRTQTGFVEISGTKAIWFPPFSLIEWHVSPGQFSWHGFISAQPPPAEWSKQAFCFDFEGQKLPGSLDEIVQAVQSAREGTVIERETNANLLSHKIKEAIQRDFRQDLKISDLARKFNVSHEHIIRTFKNTYGITPVYLRSRLRVFSALVPLMKGQDVTSTATESGFGDLCRFTKQFTKYMKAPPLHFQNAKYLKQVPQASTSSKHLKGVEW